MTSYNREYMRKYTKDCETIRCDLCKGTFKKYNKYIHIKTHNPQLFL